MRVLAIPWYHLYEYGVLKRGVIVTPSLVRYVVKNTLVGQELILHLCFEATEFPDIQMPWWCLQMSVLLIWKPYTMSLNNYYVNGYDEVAFYIHSIGFLLK